MRPARTARGMPARIAYVINVDFALLHFLLPLMRAAQARGHAVFAICADGPLLAGIRAEGFRVIPAPLVRRASPVAQLRAFWHVRSVLRREQPDIVHAHMPLSGFIGRMAAWAAGVPHIAYTGHGFLFNQPGPWARRGVAYGMEWVAARVTDTYLTVSAAEAADARRLWITRHAIPVGNGRDPAVFRPDPSSRAAIRATLGTAPDRVVVIAVSRLVRHKGIPELVAAMRTVDAELWMVGERLASDRGDDMDALMAASGLGSRLRRLGYRTDIPALLAGADIFCLPSHFEGLPMSIIEAMLTALPVVATDIRGPREQVVEGETGLLVPPGSVGRLAEALGRLAADAGLRERLGQAGRARALQRFDEAVVNTRTLDLLGL